MDQDTAVEAFAALAHPTRLAVVRVLVRHLPKGVPALVIAEKVSAKPSTLSGHLNILKQARLVTAVRHQREIHYAVDVAAMTGIARFLLADCCGGQMSRCDDVLALLDEGAAKAPS